MSTEQQQEGYWRKTVGWFVSLWTTYRRCCEGLRHVTSGYATWIRIHGNRLRRTDMLQQRIGGLLAAGVRRIQPIACRRGSPVFGLLPTTTRGDDQPQELYWRSGSVRWHGGPSVASDAPTVSVAFLHPDGTSRSVVEARVGESLLQTAHRHEIGLEGACEGVCARSTCHLILPPDMYDSLPEPSEDEEDMLDMAFGLEETSRLGCQIKVTEDMDGVELKMPAATRNFYVDGHVPKPH